MKKIYLVLTTIAGMLIANQSFADVTLTTSPVAASNITQGSNDNIVYIAKMDVTALAVSVNAIQFTLTGTHDNNDLNYLFIYYNPIAPTLTGASIMAAYSPATFAAGHLYNIAFSSVGNQTIAAGASGYFIITFGTSATATGGNTIKINGAVSPVTFGYVTVPTIINNQTDIAGTQTIQVAGVSLSSSAVAAATITQGSNDNIVYIAKMDVSTLPVAVNAIQFTLSGTHDNNDLTYLFIYYNPVAPTLAGASAIVSYIPATFAAGHTYNIPFAGPQTIAAGASGYFIITFNTNATATGGNTIKLDGAANPVSFGYTTGPTVTNNQTDIAGTQTIQIAGVGLSSSAVAAANIAQGSNDNIVYIAKMDVTTLPVAVNAIQFTLSGTHDNNDLTYLFIYYNPVAPTLTGASAIVSYIPATFATGHTYNIPFAGPQTIAAGASGYFIITFNTNATATGGNTIKLDGAASPVSFGYTTGPTITNNQTDIAGTQTIQIAGVSLSSSAVAAANIAQGTNDNIVYIAKIDVTTLPVAINAMQFTLSGTHDNNDLTYLFIYYNPVAPTLAGASAISTYIPATFAAGHTYNIPFAGAQTIAAGASGYFIITFNTNAAATPGNTIKLDGAVSPVGFSYTTGPAVTNNQTDIAGTQTIQAAGVTLSSAAVTAANIGQGSTNTIVYIAKMDVTTLPVAINAMQFTLSGTHDNNDLDYLFIYYNPVAPTLAGASAISTYIPATFAAGHPYNIPLAGAQTIAAGASGYFIITVNVNVSATPGNTVKLNGATNPVSFTYTTAPPVTNNQTDIAGTQTFSSVLPLTLLNFSGTAINKQNVLLQWTTAGELNTKNFEVEWSNDGIHFTSITVLPAANNSLQNKQYSFTHKTPVEGNNYYRLKITDTNGWFTYSAIIRENILPIKTGLTIYPNPATNYLFINGASNYKTIQILDVNGKIVLQQNILNELKSINITLLNSGTYMLKAISDTETQTLKFIKL